MCNGKCCIAVIDDEPALLQMLQDVLEIEGYHVVAVSNPDLVARVGLAGDPDLFLIDLMLPGLSGVELAAHLRTCGFGFTPMIAMSASRLLLELAAASDLFQETLSKPFDLGTLLDRVGRFAA